MPNLALLYAVVSLSGGCVLAIEILGTRILGPFYGVSLFLWSALITVTLAALSIGYALGGRWADRGPTMKRLAITLFLAGAWTLLVPWIKGPLIDLTAGLGIRAAVILSSGILFGPPLLLLGIVSPYAIRLRARDVEHVGSTAGNLYAVSTMASVIAAVVTGFWLIPNVGVQRLVMYIGVVLIGAGVLALLGGRGGRKAVMGILLFVSMGLLAAFVPVREGGHSENIVFVGQSPYAQVRVLDREFTRYLLIDGGVHTSMDFATGRSWHQYVTVLELAKNYFEEPGRMLLIGLGGGSVAMSYLEDGWQVDAVEIDPLIPTIAREYFDYDPERIGTFVMDGRRYLQTHEEPYDLIIFDAFGSSSIPFHLITEEVFALVKSRLSANGVFAMNVESVGWRHPLVTSVSRTLRSSFARVLALPMAEPPNTLGNVIVLAMDRDDVDRPEQHLEHPQDHMDSTIEHFYAVQGFHAWNNRFEPEGEGALLLTDDRNPSDLWAEQINRIARRRLMDEFYEPEEFGW